MTKRHYMVSIGRGSTKRPGRMYDASADCGASCAVAAGCILSAAEPALFL